jgi:hypothetical protein
MSRNKRRPPIKSHGNKKSFLQRLLSPSKPKRRITSHYVSDERRGLSSWLWGPGKE